MTSDLALQKAEEIAEGGESALGPDGEVRSLGPVPARVLLNESLPCPPAPFSVNTNFIFTQLLISK